MVAKSIAESFEEMPLLAAAPVKGAFPLSCFFTLREREKMMRFSAVQSLSMPTTSY